MDTVKIIELGISVVIFALSLAGYIHKKSFLKTEKPPEDEAEAAKFLKKHKKQKKLCFVGMIFGAWFMLGVLITAFSGIKGGLKIEFTMFSERVNLFGISIAETTLIASGVVIVISILLLLFRLIAIPKFGEAPRGIQNVAELCVETIDSFTIKAVGENASRFLSPYMLSLALFLVGSASVELLGLRAPTSDLTVTISMGLLTFVFLNYYGFKKLGFSGRLKAMGGPVAPMRVIMIPLKMVSDIAVPVSLACRLFGNMLGGMIVMDLLKGALGGYAAGIPAIAGLYFNLFHPLIQAYIFITLSLTFIDEAMETSEPETKQKKKKKKHGEDSTDNSQISAEAAI